MERSAVLSGKGNVMGNKTGNNQKMGGNYKKLLLVRVTFVKQMLRRLLRMMLPLKALKTKVLYIKGNKVTINTIDYIKQVVRRYIYPLIRLMRTCIYARARMLLPLKKGALK